MSDFDQQNQNVNNQVNINIQTNPSQDADVLLKQAIEFLEARSFQQSINLLHDAIKADPSLSNAYYYLALALLKGRRPKVLKRNEIEEIDQLLVSAIKQGYSDGTIQWFRVLLRDDYYNGNRMRCPSPSVSEIIASINPNSTNKNRLQLLLKKLPMNDNQLYVQLVNCIL